MSIQRPCVLYFANAFDRDKWMLTELWDKGQTLSALSTIQSAFVLWFWETDSTQQEINYIHTNMAQRPPVICIFSSSSLQPVCGWRTEFLVSERDDYFCVNLCWVHWHRVKRCTQRGSAACGRKSWDTEGVQ